MTARMNLQSVRRRNQVHLNKKRRVVMAVKVTAHFCGRVVKGVIATDHLGGRVVKAVKVIDLLDGKVVKAVIATDPLVAT